MLKKISWPVLSLFLSACVTINIYFPAAAAEEAARVIVRDVLKSEQQPESKPEAKEGEQDQSAVEPAGAGWRLAGHLVGLLVVPAQAAQADIDIDTPAIKRLRQSMSRRQQALQPHYRSGAIGFDQSGRLSVRDLKVVPLKERNKLKKLVADENRDRDALYREIARANGHPEWEQDIRNTFSRIWVEEAPGGYWYKKGGSWKKK